MLVAIAIKVLKVIYCNQFRGSLVQLPPSTPTPTVSLKLQRSETNKVNLLSGHQGDCDEIIQKATENPKCIDDIPIETSIYMDCYGVSNLSGASHPMVQSWKAGQKSRPHKDHHSIPG